jgi:antitoxin component YwqK of YwqJK toxin-antitoxin module
MSSAKTPPKRRRWLRLITQYSLRTLLVLTTLAGVACWWFLRPEAREEELAGKYLKLRRQVRVKAMPDVAAQAGYATQEDFWVVNQGAWRVKDEHGELLIDGRYADDQPHGKWTVYHVNGQKAAQGAVYCGARTGLWRTWDEEGRLRSEATYKVIESTRPWSSRYPGGGQIVPIVGMITPPLAQFGGGGMMGGAPMPLPSIWTMSRVAVRHGPAKAWYANGQIQLEGQYHEDRKDGPWSFYDEQGRITAQGTFRADERDGQWTVLDGASGKRQTIEFVAGLTRPEHERLLASLQRDLIEGATNQKIAAASALEKLGDAGVPCLLVALQNPDVEVQILALRTLARLKALPDEAIAPIAGLIESNDPRVARLATLAIYLTRPAERDALRGRLLNSLEKAGDNIAVAGLLQMYQADQASRPVILAPLVERMGRAEANYDGSLDSFPNYVGKIADLGWEVLPHLEAIYPTASADGRWFIALVLGELVRRQPTSVERASGGVQTHYEIPAAAQPLLDRAKADADPRVREAAAGVGFRWVPGSGAFGGQAGGFF